MANLARTLVATAPIALGALACVPTFDDDLSLIASRRILAVRSVPAEAEPGTPVTFTVLVASAGDDTSAADVSWEFCLSPKPLTELGPVAQACVEAFGSGSELLQPVGRGFSVTAELPGDGCRSFGPLGPPAGSDGVAGRPADPDATGGYYQPVLLGQDGVTLGSPRITCGVAGLPNDQVIRFASGYRPNENPAIAALTAQVGDDTTELVPGTSPSATFHPGDVVRFDVSWAACPREAECGDGLCTSGENVRSCAEDCSEGAVGCTGAETYLAADTETRTVVERREGMTVSWFTTAGKFDSEQTGRTEDDEDGTDVTNGWTAPSETGEVRLWAVLRDDRGGVDFREYRVTIEP